MRKARWFICALAPGPWMAAPIGRQAAGNSNEGKNCKRKRSLSSRCTDAFTMTLGSLRIRTSQRIGGD